MVTFYGQPLNFTTVYKQSLSLTDCVSYCYTTDSCVAIYNIDNSEECLVFEFGTISTLEQLDGSEGKVMGVKMISNNSTSCPAEATGNSMETGYQENPTTYQPYKITTNDTVWKITPFGCPANFTMFNRPLGNWCIGVVPSDTCISWNDSTAACASTYGGVLSGLQTLEERDYVIATGEPWLLAQSLYSIFGFWVNGYRKTSCMETVKSASCNGTNEFNYTDPLLSAFDGYTWAYLQPSGIDSNPPINNCLNLYFNSSTVLGIDDYQCFNATANNETICYKGYVCGVAPS
ncbi:unnamed protein product [Caenorhabditis brenneri]